MKSEYLTHLPEGVIDTVRKAFENGSKGVNLALCKKNGRDVIEIVSYDHTGELNKVNIPYNNSKSNKQ